MDYAEKAIQTTRLVYGRGDIRDRVLPLEITRAHPRRYADWRALVDYARERCPLAAKDGESHCISKEAGGCGPRGASAAMPGRWIGVRGRPAEEGCAAKIKEGQVIMAKLTRAEAIERHAEFLRDHADAIAAAIREFQIDDQEREGGAEGRVRFVVIDGYQFTRTAPDAACPKWAGGPWTLLGRQEEGAYWYRPYTDVEKVLR